MAYNKKGYYKRVEQIQAIAREHYEPGRYDRCYKWVWHKHIQPVYGIGYRAFLSCLKVEVPEDASAQEPKDRRQLFLFDD